MAKTVTMKVEGLRELGERMRQLSAKVATQTAARAVNAGAQIVKKQAKANITSSPSVEKGYLLDAVITKKIPKSQTSLTAEYVVTVRGRGKVNKKTGKRQAFAPHAAFVEYGTVHMPAEPFLRPALERKQHQAVSAIKDKLAADIAKAGK